MSRSIRISFIASIIIALAIHVSCVGKEVKPENRGEPDYEARVAITEALENEKALDENATAVIRLVRDGQYSLEQGMDDLVDQTRNLLSLIASVTLPSKPRDENLAAALELTGEFLRNRIHQIEDALVAGTPQELSDLYERGRQALEAEREKIVELVLQYDPSLGEFLK